MKGYKWFLVIVLFLVHSAVHAVSTLDELVSKVRTEAAKDIRFDQERERRFIQERDQQQAKLNKLRSELAGADQRADMLRGTYQKDETKLAELDEQNRFSSRRIERIIHDGASKRGRNWLVVGPFDDFRAVSGPG